MSSGIQEGMSRARNVEPLEPVAPAADEQPLEPVAPAAEQELAGKELAAKELARKELAYSANDLAANVAGIVLDTMKQDDGPCKWVLQVFWQTSCQNARMVDVRYLQGVWVMGKLKFSVQQNTKESFGFASKAVVLPLFDKAEEAGFFFIHNKEYNSQHMHMYLMHVDKMHEKIPFPWTGPNLSAYISICNNSKDPNPVPVRYF